LWHEKLNSGAEFEKPRTADVVRMSDTVVTGPKADASGSRRGLSIVVALGIGLFIVGFFITIVSLSLTDNADASGTPALAEGTGVGSGSGSFLLVGLMLSLVGLVSATTAPAAYFIHRRRQGLCPGRPPL
jgi:hypothetical protein